MKRFLSITLVVCMLLASLTFMTFAETPATDEAAVTAGYKFRIGAEGTGTYYNDFVAALEGLGEKAEGETGTIYQITNYAHTNYIKGDDNVKCLQQKLAKGSTVKVVGTNKTEKFQFYFDMPLTSTSSWNSNLSAFFPNFTFEDLHVVFNSRIRSGQNNLALTFNNCVVDVGAIVGANGTLTPTWETNNSHYTWIFIDGTNCSLNLNNSTVNTYCRDQLVWVSTASSSNPHTAKTFNINLTNSSKIVFKAATAHSTIIYSDVVNDVTNINVDGTSSIIAEAKESGNGTALIKLKNQTNNSSANLNLEQGAVINLASGSFVSGINALNVVDKGATITLGEKVMKAGFMLPKLKQVGTSTNVIGWKIGDSLYNSGATIAANESANAATVTPIAYDVTTGLSMASGASVLVNNPTGIRYTATVSDELRAALAGATVTYGAIIAPNAKVTSADAFTKEALGEGNYVDTATKFKWAVENKEYRVVLTNILDTSMEFTAIPYVTVTYADGSVATIYGAKGDVRSISGVAASALDAAAITADEYNTIMGN